MFSGTNSVQVSVCEFHLLGMHIIDELIFVHKIDAGDIVIEFCDDIYQVCKFSSFNPEVHVVDPYRVHCIARCGYANLSIRDLPRFLLSKSSV